MQFKVGDKVVYGSHGISNIKRIEPKHIGGVIKEFYVLHTQYNMTVIVPVSDADKVGLRPISTKVFAESVIEFIVNEKIPVSTQMWNTRYRDFMEKIKTGKLLEVAKVYKALTQLKKDKDLSFGERKMLDMARSMLIAELTISLDLKEEAVLESISL